MRTGFVGLGAMGTSMARNLHRASLLHGVWNRTGAKAQTLAAELQCAAPAQLTELAQTCEVVVMCVSADRDVVARGRDGPALRAGSIVIDCSTVGADTARRQRTACWPRGRVPRCAGEQRRRRSRQGHARDHGRRPGNRPRARTTVLQAMGATITHFGAQGASQAAKATNQIMVAGINRANAEALAFAAAYGLDLAKVIGTLGHGAAANWYLTHRGPNMERGAYPPGFRVRLHQKDLNICREMARARGAELPVVEATLNDYPVTPPRR